MIDSFSGRWRFLSNFYPSEITHEGIRYPTVEHYYVSMKIKDDQIIDGKFIPFMDCREMLAKVANPGTVKRIGRGLKLRKNWDDLKLDVLKWGVKEKFKDEKMKMMLLSTGKEFLLEGNLWHDNFFGSCMCDKCGNSGQNNLGKILMEIRDGN